jgi:hypothetical protein
MLEYSYDVDGILQVSAVDNESGVTILQDDVSYGVARDKRELKAMSDRAKTAVETGTLGEKSIVQVRDAEGSKLIEQARVKVIPFLDAAETAPIEMAVTHVESAASDADLATAKAELKRLLSPYSYLI